MKSQKFSLRKRIQSFGFAFNGLKILISEEHNSRIHLVAAIVAVIGGFFFAISRLEWIAIVFCIGWVLSMEILNSAIENIADFICPQKDEAIQKIKDLAAAAVLVSAIGAFLVGLIIFIPKIIELFM